MSNISFQLILDTKNVVLSPTPNSNQIRANITGLDINQIESIIDCLVDAGPEVVEYFKQCLDDKTNSMKRALAND